MKETAEQIYILDQISKDPDVSARDRNKAKTFKDELTNGEKLFVDFIDELYFYTTLSGMVFL